MLFTPNIEVVGHINPTASIEQIESEVMLYSASLAFAREHGGPLTQSVLDVIENKLDPNKHYVIDTKSVMLMPGMYPAIPGWHCDGVIRHNQFAQPDLEKINTEIQHWAVLVSSHYEGTSNTEFLTEPVVVHCEQDRVWGSTNEYLEKFRGLPTLLAKDGEIIQFSQPTLHRAKPAINKGWRFFFRLSEYHMPPLNKIRHQVQVYAAISSGW